jgi:hypothetical protein
MYDRLHAVVAASTVADAKYLRDCATLKTTYPDAIDDTPDEVGHVIAKLVDDASAVLATYKQAKWADAESTITDAFAACRNVVGGIGANGTWKDDLAEGASLKEVQQQAAKTLFKQKGLAMNIKQSIAWLGAAYQIVEATAKKFNPTFDLKEMDKERAELKMLGQVTMIEGSLLQSLKKDPGTNQKKAIEGDFNNMSGMGLPMDKLQDTIRSEAHKANQ